MCMCIAKANSSSKGDLENDKPMKGSVSQRVVDLIRQLQAEGEL
jgi:hypothetical protein